MKNFGSISMLPSLLLIFLAMNRQIARYIFTAKFRCGNCFVTLETVDLNYYSLKYYSVVVDAIN